MDCPIAIEKCEDNAPAGRSSNIVEIFKKQQKKNKQGELNEIK